MRILQVVHSLPFLNLAGTEIYAYDLSRELSRRHKVYIFSRSCDTRAKEYEVTESNKEGMEIFLLNNTFKYADNFQMYYDNPDIDQSFAKICERIRPDIVHIHHLIFLSTGIIKILNERSIPVVFHLHDYWSLCPKWHILANDLYPCEKVFSGNFDQECPGCLGGVLNINKEAKSIYRTCQRFLPDPLVRAMKRAYFSCTLSASNPDRSITMLKERRLRIADYLKGVNYFIAPSEFLKNKFVQSGTPAEKIKVIHNGIDKRPFINRAKKRSAKVRFAFIGTLLPAKGLHILIQAFNGIDTSKAELTIYGRIYSYTGFEDYLPYLKKIAKNKSIRFAGEFTHGMSAKTFSEIDVLVVPSIWYENYPLVIQEALLSGTPVIASRIGGIPEMIKDGVNGTLFTPGDIDELSKKMALLLENEEIRNRLKEDAPQVTDLQEHAAALEELYGKTVKRK